jgi:hypothetical protein
VLVRNPIISRSVLASRKPSPDLFFSIVSSRQLEVSIFKYHYQFSIHQVIHCFNRNCAIERIPTHAYQHQTHYHHHQHHRQNDHISRPGRAGGWNHTLWLSHRYLHSHHTFHPHPRTNLVTIGFGYGFSFVSVPVLLRTSPAELLAKQWYETYVIGKNMAPPLAVASAVCFGFLAVQCTFNSSPPSSFWMSANRLM